MSSIVLWLIFSRDHLFAKIHTISVWLIWLQERCNLLRKCYYNLLLLFGRCPWNLIVAAVLYVVCFFFISIDKLACFVEQISNDRENELRKTETSNNTFRCLSACFKQICVFLLLFVGSNLIYLCVEQCSASRGRLRFKTFTDRFSIENNKFELKSSQNRDRIEHPLGWARNIMENNVEFSYLYKTARLIIAKYFECGFFSFVPTWIRNFCIIYKINNKSHWEQKQKKDEL